MRAGSSRGLALALIALANLAAPTLFAQTPPEPAAPQPTSRLLENLKLFDGTGAPMRTVAALWLVDGRVQAVVDAGEALPNPLPEGTIRHELDGAFVVPGLIDTHVHVARFPDTRARADRILEQALRGGVTAVRDLGGDARALAEIERTRRTGEALRPTVVSSSLTAGPPVFEMPQVRGLAADHEPGTAPWAILAPADDAPGTTFVQLVAAARGSGVAGLKLYGNIGLDALQRLVKEAHAQELEAWAHGTVFPVGPAELVAAGVDSLSHAPYLVWAAAPQIPADFTWRTKADWKGIAPDHPRIIALLEAMATRGVSLDATLYVFNEMQNFSPMVKAGWAGEAARWGAQVTQLAHQAGVSVTTGTDWFEPRRDEALPHTHDELVYLVEAAGLTPTAALLAATRNGAQALGLEDHGTLVPGQVADLLVLDADPTVDVRATRRLRLVFKAGQPVEPLSTPPPGDPLSPN